MEPLKPSGDKKRQNPKTFNRNSFSISSSGEFASDTEWHDDVDPKGSTNRKRKLGFRGVLYAKSGKRKSDKHSSSVINDVPEALDEDEDSHLFTLVKNKEAVNKYAKKLLKSHYDGRSSRNRAFSDGATAKLQDEINITSCSKSSSGLSYDEESSKNNPSIEVIATRALTDEQKEEAEKESKEILLLQESFCDYTHLIHKFPIEVRMENLYFSVPHEEASLKITTVYNSSFVYKAIKKLRQLTTGVDETKQIGVRRTKHVLDNISLCLKPGKM